MLLCFLLAGWATIPMRYALILAAMIPALIIVGNYSIDCVMDDLRITKERIGPGRGQILHSVHSLFYTAPVALHYLRHVLELS